ncbi:MAG: hypothetical protein P4L55_18510 [Syntrophobacteraceae bacterium]|nr:hypothetical protein [Syntrophobacteraceae bacterium]
MKKPKEPRSASIGLIDMGHTPDMVMRIVAANLQTMFEVQADILVPMAIPEDALQLHRGQYDAGLVLKHLSGLSFPHHPRILAITDVDLCSPVLTYVFGEAQMGAKSAIVSDFRLKHNADGAPAPSAVYYERIVKVALHEIAHTLSLYHCDTPGCLMQMSPRIDDLDKLSIHFCDRCGFVLHRNMKEFRSKQHSCK